MIYVVFIGVFLAILLVAFALDFRTWRRRKTLLSRADRLSRDLPRELENLNASLARLETSITLASQTSPRLHRHHLTVPGVIDWRAFVSRSELGEEWASHYFRCREFPDTAYLRSFVETSIAMSQPQFYAFYVPATERQLRYREVDLVSLSREWRLACSALAGAESCYYAAKGPKRLGLRVRSAPRSRNACTVHTHARDLGATPWTVIRDERILALAFA